MTRRRTLFFLSLSGLAGCSRSNVLRLNVFNWSNYIGPATLQRFESETGIRVRYAVYESNEEMLARALTGNSGWDVVFPSNYFIGPMRELGLLATIDRSRLTGLANLAPRFAAPPWDPNLHWCVPFMWGSSGILANPRLVPPPQAYSDLWDPRYGGRMTMLDDPPEVFGAALFKLGLPLNESSDQGLRRAYAEALQQKPLLRAYLNAEMRDQIAAGDLAVCQSWATTAQQAIDSAPHLTFTYPREGFALYADCAAILRESRRQDLAHRFLDFLLRPDVACRLVQSFRASTVNAAALALLPRPIAALQTLFPDSETLARAQWFATLPPAAQRLRDRLWTELKSA
jgi:spermidine/putrescine-binding protein